MHGLYTHAPADTHIFTHWVCPEELTQGFREASEERLSIRRWEKRRMEENKEERGEWRGDGGEGDVRQHGEQKWARKWRRKQTEEEERGSDGERDWWGVRQESWGGGDRNNCRVEGWAGEWRRGKWERQHKRRREWMEGWRQQLRD